MYPDVFKNDAFSMSSLTAAVNRIPNTYGRVTNLGLFKGKGITTTVADIETLAGHLNMLPTNPRGDYGSVGKSDKRTLRQVSVPQITHNDTVKPEDIQGIRAFGSENAVLSAAQVAAEKQLLMYRKLELTWEWMRVSALKGVTKDGSNNTLVDWYSFFNINSGSPIVHDWVLDNSATEVITKILTTKRAIEDSMQGEVYTGLHCLCSPSFYDAFTTHAKVVDAFKYFQTAQQLSGDYRNYFRFAEVTFEEYRGKATLADGTTSVDFIDANSAWVFPLGTQNTFVEVYSPGDFMDTVNTVGLPVYSKSKEKEYNRGMDLMIQSNPLMINLRPELVIKVTI